MTTHSESEESFPDQPSSDLGNDPEWTMFTEKPKKYYFSGTVQDGNKGYFVEWYIDQKVEC